jgi:hypothetical protein
MPQTRRASAQEINMADAFPVIRGTLAVDVEKTA